ncbi:MAG: hypothetical protein ACPGUX_01990 [Halocynthiibacter sp.]
MELNRRPVASLWIGTKLHYINQLCLKSHLLQGHPVILYCTDEVSNVPEGVEVRPATEIMDISSQRVKETSASFWSNVFRYKMIRKTGAIWIDCDAFCHEPFPEGEEWIFAGHGMRGALNCGVVGLPAQGELMDALLDYYDNLPDYPAWWNRKQRDKMDALPTDMPHATRIYKAERTAFGPQAFTHFVKTTGNLHHARPPSVLYPVPFQLVDIFFDPHGSVEGWMQDDTLSVHLYTNGIKPYWQNNAPLPNSYVARMCTEVGIDPVASLKGGDCDIEPAGRQKKTTRAAVAVPTTVTSPDSHKQIEELEAQLKKAGRHAKRKAIKAWADGVVSGVCGQIRMGDVAIDLGVGNGDISAQLLKSGAEVIGFEPTPETAQKIRARFENNPLYTFYDSAAVAEIETPSAGNQIDFIKFLKDLIEKRGKISFLKMNIGGDELALLEKMDAENLFENIRYTAAETHMQKDRELRPRFRALREKFSEKYSTDHVKLDWK